MARAYPLALDAGTQVLSIGGAIFGAGELITDDNILPGGRSHLRTGVRAKGTSSCTRSTASTVGIPLVSDTVCPTQ